MRTRGEKTKWFLAVRVLEIPTVGGKERRQGEKERRGEEQRRIRWYLDSRFPKILVIGRVSSSHN